MIGQIFISYRREESRWSARSLHDRLCRDFDLKQIFMDIDAIALGEDFVKAIETTVAKCDVLVAVIGNNWLDSKDDRGDKRLDNPEDFVRMEIATALKREIRVIPVLVDGALMPRSTDLPEDLKPLVRRNALRITDTSFDGDCQRLVAAIKQVLEKAATEEQERERSRLDVENREREERQRREAESSEAQPQDNERLANERRKKDRLEAERLEAEQRQRESASKGNIPSPSQDREPVQCETPPFVQSPGTALPKSSTPLARLVARLRVPFMVFALILIVGVIWLAASKLNYAAREVVLVTPTPILESTPTPSLNAARRPILESTPTRA